MSSSTLSSSANTSSFIGSFDDRSASPDAARSLTGASPALERTPRKQRDTGSGTRTAKENQKARFPPESVDLSQRVLAQLQTVLFHFPPLAHAIIEQLLEFDQDGSLVPTHTNVQLQSAYTAVIQRHLAKHKELNSPSVCLPFLSHSLTHSLSH
eukprot:TRINITY_DN7182_c1_g2_i1.p1 TRINITY_DN7182_c1_g2~~TRINITY_DN7182_c1_g2_i1.p1  ORF type:complete len:171 (+),score=38.56 TRINITY_DN7182_c1_g2_i1:53-514(+)